MSDALDLFAQPLDGDPSWLTEPATRIERGFRAFHAANPHVYRALEAAALRAHSAGASRIGIAKLVEDVRYRPDIETTVGNEFKLNNNFRALYARLLIHRHPQLGSIIALRDRRERGAA